MSDLETFDTDHPLSIERVKCRLFGHDFVYRRSEGTRYCRRCGTEESYNVEETHEDESASKGQTRYRIEDGTLYFEAYQTTAWGEDAEYWQWYPVSRMSADEEDLIALKKKIDEALVESGEFEAEIEETVTYSEPQTTSERRESETSTEETSTCSESDEE